jgi:hypothetical protein
VSTDELYLVGLFFIHNCVGAYLAKKGNWAWAINWWMVCLMLIAGYLKV